MAIPRRSFLLAGVGLAASPAVTALPVPTGNELAFRLIRQGSEIGRHTLTFERQSDVLTVNVTVTARVTMLGIPIVRYAHHAVETWQGNRLMGIVGDTDKNGQVEWVRARRDIGGLVVQGSRTTRYIAPEPATATSYWNKRMLDGPMISLEDGVLLRPNVAVDQTESIRLASGSTIPAAHYNLSGAFAVDVWYDRSDSWVGLAFTVPDGSSVRYERL